MRRALRSLNRIRIYIDKTNESIGRAVSWLVVGVVILTFMIVVQRYLFSYTARWHEELVLFLHSIIFLAAAGYTLKSDGHVRVDVLFQKLSEKGKAIMNLAGSIIFIWTVSIALIYFSWDYVIASWKLQEQSAEFNGMKGIFILKTFIWVWAGLLFMQSISLIIKSIIIIRR